MRNGGIGIVHFIQLITDALTNGMKNLSIIMTIRTLIKKHLSIRNSYINSFIVNQSKTNSNYSTLSNFLFDQ